MDTLNVIDFILSNFVTTFIGDCQRVKIFRKSQSSVSDYEFVQEIKLESNELLVDLETTAKNAHVKTTTFVISRFPSSMYGIRVKTKPANPPKMATLVFSFITGI